MSAYTRKREAERLKAERAVDDARCTKWLAEESARIAGQRQAFLNLPRVPSREALQQAMLNRAWELLNGGRAEEADAILEFLPERATMVLINEFLGDDI